MVPQPYDEQPPVALVDQLRRLGQRLTRAVNERMPGGGVSYARLRVLIWLEQAGSVRAIDLTRHFGLAPRTITEAIDGLQRGGLVTREPDAADRRVKRIVITAAGRAAVNRSAGGAAALGLGIAEMLGSQDLARLQRQLGRIEHYLDRPGGSQDGDAARKPPGR